MKEEIRKYLSEFPESEAFAVTLTMKQHTQGKSLDEINASLCLRHFLNRLNRTCFSNAFSRGGKRISVMPVLEKSYDGRLHYHLTIINPYPDNAEFFVQSIRDCWQKILFADSQVDIKPVYDIDNWHSYITKGKKPNIDWENFHIA